MEALEMTTRMVQSPYLESPWIPQVMLVEDDAAMRDMVQLTLERSGFCVDAFGDGARALDHLGTLLLRDPEERALDLIVTDNRMPYFEGVDILKALRLAGERVPFVMITAFGDTELHAQVEREVAAVVLDKPFDLDELVQLARHFTIK